ncbi:polyadenylate-binding protein-interacting protein 2B [Tribolium castaneum]|nr:PREDICTED: polyadenylate-binding protein-interacting protein 2B [Tribolium castaneum]|eukprot:XP_968714.2 PREDICTED: polyadenylate-binding protein-interacting protein 2B [Tribolium castaneum]
MKMPSNQSSENGLYDYEDTTYISESIENNGVEEFNASAEDDFSEYLWMENEEEFDKEVMQRLEEEALMEECIEAMLADENSEVSSNHVNGVDDNNEISNMINNLKLDCPEVVKESNLNPLAAEFIPGGSPTAVETVTGSS